MIAEEAAAGAAVAGGAAGAAAAAVARAAATSSRIRITRRRSSLPGTMACPEQKMRLLVPEDLPRRIRIGEEDYGYIYTLKEEP